MYNDLAYAPFGEQYAAAGTTGVTNTSFAGNNEDTTTNLYDAMNREYGIQGRWPSPDPAGVAAANPANPQSWNRYAYVLNNPLDLSDPSGFGPEKVPPAVMEDGSGGEVDGCNEFDWANAWCQQTMKWEDPNWSPFGINFNGVINGEYINYTFDTWDQYAEWRTTVAAGAQDPCVIANFGTSGNYTGYTVNTFMKQQECSDLPITPQNPLGGQWVPPGFTFEVDSKSGRVVSISPQDHSDHWNICAGAAVVAIYGLTWGGMAQAGVITAPAGWVSWAIGGISLLVDVFTCH
ncbi:MAG TPA: RHS repeat-associated core domain-containing protein [Candidatus Acidoferrales bacterium]|nr:RHS repeat-associated core domain-containing protein [Candidatus Acidoferrales bacterium]